MINKPRYANKCDNFKYTQAIVIDVIIIGVPNMENMTPNLIGERLPVMAYVDPETFMKIEQQRGDIARSKYVSKILKKMMNQ